MSGRRKLFDHLATDTNSSSICPLYKQDGRIHGEQFLQFYNMMAGSAPPPNTHLLAHTPSKQRVLFFVTVRQHEGSGSNYRVFPALRRANAHTLGAVRKAPELVMGGIRRISKLLELAHADSQMFDPNAQGDLPDSVTVTDSDASDCSSIILYSL